MTPLLKQYWEIKSLHPDKILFFRMGDFYELFFDDAVKAAPVLGITLTQRNKKSQDETPMCGVPHHSVAGHINTLLKKGHKVALCDQIEDPKMAKGLVKRAVTRVLTPGMVYDLETLNAHQPHYLMAYDDSSVSYVDTTTGESFYFLRSDAKDLSKWIGLLPAAEIVVSEAQRKILTEQGTSVQVISVHETNPENKMNDWKVRLRSKFPSQERIISYVKELSQEQVLSILKPFEERQWQQTLGLSPMVVRHLEFFSTYTGSEDGSLFEAVNLTKTSAGSRRFRQWLLFPLTDKKSIEVRQNQIHFWRKDLSRLKKLREILTHLGDLERRLAKISLATGHARDLQALGQSLETGMSAFQIAGLEFDSTILKKLSDRIAKTIVDEPPLAVKQGGLIREGVNAVLDEYITLTVNSQALLQKLEAEEREKTGISSLKIRYNQVFGYYLEVTNTHKEKVPREYRRKQTLANAERYTTDALDELEKKIITAQTKRSELEYQIFEELRSDIIRLSSDVLTFADQLANIDVLSALAWLSLERNFVCPQFNTNNLIDIKASRHPVVERTTTEHFVANDIKLLPRNCMLLTGPNMAGKSTLMRQVAITAILAQMGSFVPASEANLPLFDQIFTRIGASDQLSQGLSTFMVEMTETAEILSRATNKSLVILDEIGRGTSTYDGMSLAQSILEFIVTRIGCQTFFATHYHELTTLSETFREVQNAHMSISEKKGTIRFLHVLTSGPALRSYGIQVAQRAGLPQEVTNRANTLLKKFENSSAPSPQMLLFSTEFEEEAVSENEKEIIEFLKDLDINSLSPLSALNKLSEIKNKII